mmetsp:Transcript_28732/g.58842  ORF Transcript_28732/g.58842 Transcript_28732/m.58842 type:complete len:225 (-) Transcript_28732:25-699(-)|eukprot:CAMPEP_0183315804 /NCGR_PEP_ID=MMETSP0160_2-20130417/52912_1 /TAXON_ID=2839 ORGANISM="Odontella Sinensis, Strain Grunow 1884" /NCGR_SAMPLE_ID=MMETSP0160_2 /ASSEMBLY_ACC=CAM_ASM_000250 /LENGTH=224 /DNA_ID=CAMNT_0025481471 /DNA_START=71 /DNA_END=745 /DNA_ORIENTATION=-
MNDRLPGSDPFHDIPSARWRTSGHPFENEGYQGSSPGRSDWSRGGQYEHHDRASSRRADNTGDDSFYQDWKELGLDDLDIVEKELAQCIPVEVSVRKRTKETLAGVGVKNQVRKCVRKILVTEIVEGGLFDETDLQVGDAIIGINGVGCSDMKAAEAMDMIINKKGKITLLVARSFVKGSTISKLHAGRPYFDHTTVKDQKSHQHSIFKAFRSSMLRVHPPPSK